MCEVTKCESYNCESCNVEQSVNNTEALPIPYYNNPEDYSSIMSVLKSRKK